MSAWVAVSEISKARGKGATINTVKVATLLLASGAVVPPAMAAFTSNVTETVTGEIVDAQQFVEIGGVANDTSIISGGYQVNRGGVTNKATVIDGGRQGVAYGGVSNDTTINNGGQQEVAIDGVANSAIVNEGGVQQVFEAGLADRAVVNMGGRQYVAGGVANNTLINSGGMQGVVSGGIASNSIIQDGGVQAVGSGGELRGATVNSGGTQLVQSNGVAGHSVINGDGAQVVDGDAAIVSDTTINSGGQQSILNGLANTTIINDGGLQVVDGEAASASETTINVGGKQSLVNGSASATIINGGLQAVDGTFAHAVDATINNGGQQKIRNGWTHKTTINEGGLQVLDNGYATESIINSGGQQQIFGGQAHATTVNDRGLQVVYDGGTSEGTTLRSGGKLLAGVGSYSSLVNQEVGGILVASTDANVSGTNSLGSFYINAITHQADNVLIEKGGSFVVAEEGDSAHDTTINRGSLSVRYGALLTGTTRLIDGTLTASGAAGVITDGDLVYDYSGAIGQDGMYSTGLSMLGAGSVIKQGAGGLHIEHSTKNQGSELAGGLQLKGGTLWLEDGWHGGAVDKAVLSLSGADSMHAIVDKAVLEGGSGLVLADAATNAQLTIKDTALQAASGTLLLEAKNGSQLTTNVERSTLTGDIAFRDSSSGWLNLLDNSRLTGTIDPVNVKVDGSSHWDVTGNSEVGALINDGMVDFR
ncbi:AIDA repeat-containing protein, partial [Pseudomonas sp. NPDC090755]|uniref:AIDA repeat-containing protein n=1 Tax=Pseudomonas sp. NPDC090755 TaxID=3364481 RepID=UPI00383A91EF